MLTPVPATLQVHSVTLHPSRFPTGNDIHWIHASTSLRHFSGSLHRAASRCFFLGLTLMPIMPSPSGPFQSVMVPNVFAHSIRFPSHLTHPML
jgi:hypothetical protein